MSGWRDGWAAPDERGPWLMPSADSPAEPRWGHARGMQLGLAPLAGPRGLLRVYTPYLGHSPERMINFIAVEPIPVGSDRRGFSELEHSALDDAPGKRFWLGDPGDPGDHGDPGEPAQDPAAPRDPLAPTAGRIETVDGVERLVHVVHVERFENGAEIDVRTEFRADRPHEVTLSATTRRGSVPLAFCVLTATMGNWARLRRLALRDGTVTPADLWPAFRRTDFTDHAAFGLDRLPEIDGEAVFAAEQDEADPLIADYAPGTAEHWHVEGGRAVQRWRAADPDPALVGQVNGRWAYWASEHPIPGGVAFENVELVEPFREGRRLTFEVIPLP